MARKKKKFKYEISLLVALIFLVLMYFMDIDNKKTEEAKIDDIPLIEINEKVEVKEYVKTKREINSINIEDYNSIGISKKKLDSILEYKEYMGAINTILELQNIPRISKKDLTILEKYFKESSLKEYKEHNINKMKEIELKYLGFTNYEIKKILEFRKSNSIKNAIELENIIGRTYTNKNIVFE